MSLENDSVYDKNTKQQLFHAHSNLYGQFYQKSFHKTKKNCGKTQSDFAIILHASHYENTVRSISSLCVKSALGFEINQQIM